MSKLLYGLILLVMFLLSLAFLSFFLVSMDGFEWLQPVVDNATKYLPMLLIPVIVAMAVTLFMRWVGKDRDEAIGLGDFLAAVIAFGLQLAVMVVWRALGNDVAGDWTWNVPDVKILSENASTIGVLGVAGLQFLAFFFFWRAKPDPKADDGGDDHDS